MFDQSHADRFVWVLCAVQDSASSERSRQNKVKTTDMETNDIPFI